MIPDEKRLPPEHDIAERSKTGALGFPGAQDVQGVSQLPEGIPSALLSDPPLPTSPPPSDDD